MSKPEITPEDWARLFSENEWTWDDPQQWLKREGIPLDMISQLVEGTLERVQGAENEDELWGILADTFMWGWIAGREFGRRK